MQIVKRWGVLVALVLTWLVLFFTLSFYTELIMAPWDAAIHLPEVGTWQRTLNDWFDLYGGSYVVSAALILVSLALVTPALQHPTLPYQMIASNLIFWGMLLIVFAIAVIINNQVLYPHPPVLYDPDYRGFHRSVFPGIAMLTVCIVWLLWLRRIGKQAVPYSTVPA